MQVHSSAGVVAFSSQPSGWHRLFAVGVRTRLRGYGPPCGSPSPVGAAQTVDQSDSSATADGATRPLCGRTSRVRRLVGGPTMGAHGRVTLTRPVGIGRD